MRVISVLVTASLLSACGVDGEPIRPSMTTHIGVGSNGTHVGTHVSASKGNMTVGVGLGL